MDVSLPLPDCHTFVSYFWVFPMSSISRVFGQALKLGHIFTDALSHDTGFISLIDEIQFMLINSCHICMSILKATIFHLYQAVLKYAWYKG